MAEYITEPSRNVPVKYNCQLAVLGGGPSGVAAAVNAARLGMSVILIERYGFPGGQATGGLVLVLCGFKDSNDIIIKGYHQELVDYLESHKAAKWWKDYIVFEPEYLKRCFDEHITSNNIQPILNTLVVDAIVQDSLIKYLIIENKSGRQALKADYFIDCTGDADSLVWCKEDFEQATKDNARYVTACFRAGGVNFPRLNNFLNEHKEEYVKIIENSDLAIHPWHWATTVEDRFFWFDTAHIHNIDITDADDLTKAELETRQYSWKIFEFYKNAVPGFENAYMVDIAPQLGVRDSRRLKAQHFITSDDYGKSFDDTILIAPYYLGIDKGIGRLEVPYRSMLPVKIKNLLVAGRAIGIEHKLIDCIREIPSCLATGQAAGIAASLAAGNNTTFKNINTAKLREILLSQGAFLS